MKDYDVICGATTCQIHVEAHPTQNNAGPVYIATPFVVEGQMIVPIMSTSSLGPAELPSSTEEGAVEEAVQFLERRLGARSTPATLAAPSNEMWTVAAPRVFPRQDL